jgi:hypothetical protein
VKCVDVRVRGALARQLCEGRDNCLHRVALRGLDGAEVV